MAHQYNKKKKSKSAHDEEPYDTYYHYTDRQGAKGIKQSKTIYGSDSATTTKDAKFGDGTYLTKLNPYHHSKHEIAKNNYGSSGKLYKSQIEQGKINHVVKVRIPRSEAPVKCVDKRAPDRSLYLYEDDIDLKRYSAEIEKVKHNRDN